MTTPVKTSTRVLVTSAIFAVAIGAAGWMWWDYVVNPWTRNGQVYAQVIQVMPRVSGTIVQLPIVDNQFVETGTLLFQIDPRTYESTVEQKEAELVRAEDEIEALKRDVEAKAAAIDRYDRQIAQAQSQIMAFQATFEDTGATYERMQKAVVSGAVSRDMLDQSKAEFDFAAARVQNAKDLELEYVASKLQAEADWARAKADLGAEGEANARLRAAKAHLHHAHLELEFTEVVAPVDGYVTNLNLRLGDHATHDHALLALVDTDSYWVSGFFKESALRHITVGDKAIVTLMSYPDKPIEGRVVSKGWGVEQEDGSSGHELLPKISATFEWIRLAQRVPVRVEFEELPEGVELVVGTTASVLVKSGTSGDYVPPEPPTPAPRASHGSDSH